MHSTIERLMNGDTQIPQYFVSAKERWEKILSGISTVSVADLAEKLTAEQSWFEHHCGGRWKGQEVMVWTGFASIYDTTDGYDRTGRGIAEAIKLAKAFESSMCSLEVKSKAHKAAMSYHVKKENGTYDAA